MHLWYDSRPCKPVLPAARGACDTENLGGLDDQDIKECRSEGPSERGVGALLCGVAVVVGGCSHTKSFVISEIDTADTPDRGSIGSDDDDDWNMTRCFLQWPWILALLFECGDGRLVEAERRFH